MTLLTCTMVGVIFAAATYLMLGRELKGVCMGVFLMGHGANLAIISTSRSPIGREPPVLGLAPLTELAEKQELHHHHDAIDLLQLIVNLEDVLGRGNFWLDRDRHMVSVRSRAGRILDVMLHAL